MQTQSTFDFAQVAAERREHRVLHEPCQQHGKIRSGRSLKAVVAAFGVALLQLVISASVGVCAEPGVVQARRMFVPAQHPERWPAGDWVPVSPQVLDTLMKSAVNSEVGDDRFSFRSAVYEATFTPQTARFEQGTATLIRSRGASEMLLFEPCNLALEDAVWLNNNAGRRAVLGTGLDGLKRLVAVENARELAVKWTHVGRKRLTGYDFDFAVPKSVVTTFRLAVPSGWQVMSNFGVVQREAADPNGQNVALETSVGDVWRVELGHSNVCRIRVQEPVTHDLSQRGIASYRLNSRVQLRSETVEQFFEFALDSLPVDSDELTVAIPPELIVSSIEDKSGRAFSWRDAGPLPDKWHALRIQISGTIAEDSSRIVIRGRQSVPPPGTGHVRVRIEPPRPIKAVLLGGNASPLSVAVESPYQLATYASGGLRQTGTSVDDDRHELVFEQFSARAYVDLQIQNSGRQSSRKLSVREYSLLNVGTTPQELDVLIELTSQARGVFVSTWQVPSEWEVTAVSLVGQSTATDADAGALSWSVTRGAGRHQRLTIDIADGLPVRKPVRLRVVGQRADRSRASLIPVPVILPEIARSVSIAFGIVGCDEPQKLQIVSDTYRRHADVDVFAESAWDELIAVFGEIPQTVWTADYWTQNDEIGLATLELPGSADSSDADPSETPDATDQEVDETAERADKNDGDGPSISRPDRLVDSELSTDSDSKVGVRGVAQQIIVSAEFESQLSPASVGRDLHHFAWTFHYSADSAPFRFQLPNASELLAVTWRGQKVAPVQEDGGWFIPLTFVSAGDQLAVEYTLPSQDVYLRETYRCHIPTADATVVQFDWHVRLRDRYSVVSFASGLTPEEASRPGNWLSWCFGPLARNGSAQIFSPVGVESWTRFFRGRSSEIPDRTEPTKTDLRTYSAAAAGLPESLTVHICDHSRLHALSWFVLAVSSLVGVLLRVIAARHRSRFALIWLSGCVASIVIVPGAYAELVGAAALGSILATLVPRSFVRPVRTKKPAAAQVSMASTITRRVVTGMMILAATCLAGSVVAQQNISKQGSVIDVLVRYQDSPFSDQDYKDFVLIRSSDFTRLSEASVRGEDASPKMLLTRAQWAVNVAESGRAEIVASIVVALQDNQADEVEIPIPARFLTGQAKCSVNGRQVAVLPSADGSRLRVPLPHALDAATMVGPGQSPVPPPVPESVDLWREYTIELGLRPLTQRSADISRISLPIPEILDSVVTLSFHRQPETVGVGRSLDATSFAPQGATEFILGPENELAITWRHTAADSVGGPSGLSNSLQQPTVELSSSIDVHPNWMDRRTHARYVVDGQEVRLIQWKLPEFCQVDLNQFRARNLVDKELRREAGQVTLLCEFDPPLTETFDFEFRWRQMQPEAVTGVNMVWASPVSPDATATPLSVSSHIAGLTSEAGFQFSPELQSLATESGVEGSDFIAAWPESGRPRIPLLAFTVLDGVVVNPGIIPSRSERTTRVSQEARIQPLGIQWTVYAEVDTAVVPAFIHEFRLDDTFRVDAVNVVEDDVDRLSHWEHENGLLTLHLRDRRSGVQNITITGQQKLNDGGRVKVPRIKPVVGESAESTLLIYGARQLQVDVEGAEAISDGPVVASTANDSDDFVGRFRLRPEQRAFIAVEQIPVTPTAWVVADVTSDEVGECYVSATIHLHAVSRRSVKIELPEWAKGNLAVTPTTDGAVVEVASDQNSITVRLPRQIPQRVEIALTARFSPQDGASFRFPPPVVSGVDKQRAVVTLSQGMADWEVLPSEKLSDLRLSEVGEFEPRLSSASDEFVAWADATRISRLASSPEFEKLPSLVVHSIRPGARQNGVARTSILLQTDRPQISLDWPQGMRLISVRVDGQVENVLPPVDGRLRLPLVGQGSMRDIELLWRTERDASAMKVQRRTMPTPRLVDAGPVRSFVIATPTRRINLISTHELQQNSRSIAVQLSRRWLEVARRRSSTSATFEAARQIAESLSAETENAVRETATDAAANLFFATQEDSTSNGAGSVVVEKVDGTQVEFWVVDSKVDRILGSILIVIVAVPMFVLLLGLETGDRIAKRPEFCWLVLGLIWWLCLKGSGAGFILGLVSCLWIAGSFVFRRRPSVALPSES
ncbi:MAG: hypothetical protein ACI8P0_000509 [Planctomycetaceae bacterium]